MFNLYTLKPFLLELRISLFFLRFVLFFFHHMIRTSACDRATHDAYYLHAYDIQTNK